MNPDEIRDLIAGGSLAVPCTILVQGGRTYTVEDADNVHIFAEFPASLVIATRRGGLAMVRLDTIEAITPLAPGPAAAPKRKGASK